MNEWLQQDAEPDQALSEPEATQPESTGDDTVDEVVSSLRGAG